MRIKTLIVQRRVWLVLGAVLLFAGPLVFGVEPYSQLKGPVSTVEEWRYKVEMKFGKPHAVLDSHTKTIYDRYLNPIETIHFTLAGCIDKRYVRTFDANNRVIEVIQYDGTGRLVTRTITEYKGLVGFDRSYDAAGRLIGAIKREIDPQGKLLRMTFYDVKTGEETGITTLSYSPEGHLLLHTIASKDGKVTFKYTYNLEGMDYVVQSETVVLGIKLISIITGYRIISTDRYGNWTEKQEFKRKKHFGQLEWVLETVYRRQITYR